MGASISRDEGNSNHTDGPEDPRSPSKDVRRTPVRNSQVTIDDPRSPSNRIDRTPIQVGGKSTSIPSGRREDARNELSYENDGEQCFSGKKLFRTEIDRMPLVPRNKE